METAPAPLTRNSGKVRTMPRTSKRLQEVHQAEGSEVAGLESDQNQMQRLAFQFWLDRGCPIGSPEIDWYRAEEEIRNRVSGSGAAA